MIYSVTTSGQHILILEPENIERLQKGEPLVSPNGQVTVFYTPDAPWLSEKIKEANDNHQLSSHKMIELIQESESRKPVLCREYHPVKQIVKGNLNES